MPWRLAQAAAAVHADTQDAEQPRPREPARQRAPHAGLLGLTAGSQHLAHQLTPIIETALRFSIRLTNKVKGTLPDYDAHEKIYRAIRNGNSEAAFRACRELIKEALMLVIKTDKART